MYIISAVCPTDIGANVPYLIVARDGMHLINGPSGISLCLLVNSIV